MVKDRRVVEDIHCGRMVVPGQHVITADGRMVVVAMVRDGVVWAWCQGMALPQRVVVRCDAWGGEHDMTLGMDMSA